MKNLAIIFLVSLVSLFSLSAQSVLEGSISNRQGESLTAVNVKFIHLTNQQLSQTVNTDEDGYFFMEQLADGAYELEISHQQYGTVIMENFEFPRDTDQVLGLQLEEIQVTTPTVRAEHHTPNHVSVAKIY